MSKCPLEHHREEWQLVVSKLHDTGLQTKEENDRLKDLLKIWNSTDCMDKCNVPWCRFMAPFDLADYYGYGWLGELINALAAIDEPIDHIPRKPGVDPFIVRGARQKGHLNK
jgi:hypothetical protein